ncbi:MAG: glycoside hydrolase family 127 protein [Phycisphaerae bacterium]|nr:glycoside hydrolase family 127 protein [Phycisphaerae bacterium]
MSHRTRRIAGLCTSVIIFGLSAVSYAVSQDQAKLERDYNVKPVPFHHVHIDDGLWTPRLETSRTVTIPYAFGKCEETGRIRNFEKAAGLREGKHEGIYFDDSDVYKVMEGAAYSLQVSPDTMMRLYLDKLIAVMGKAQWEDGYLYTFYSIPERQPQMRWTNIQSMHEQYCVGHMYEAAVAHYQVTGDASFLKIATDNADLICDIFAPDKRTDPSGHEEIEIALCRLYRATGNEKYLDQAKFFLDQRGRTGRRGPDGNGALYGEYAQDHKPVIEQTKAVGHSVRAAYLYTGMADVAALTGNREYIRAIDAIWNDAVGTKLYVTGGIGASGGNEGFSEPYELPNRTAYCETCASIANVYWNHRMFLMHDDGKYIDVLERTLYNAALSGISMQGDRFFYPNVLESAAGDERSPWFACACCPSNVARFIPSVPGYVYAHKDRDIYVNLFVGGNSTIQTADNAVTLTQETEYPWEGKVTIRVEPQESKAFSICVRIPGWARNEAVPSDLYRFVESMKDEPTLEVNGKRLSPPVVRGYARIERRWEKGDTIELRLPMPVRRIVAHEAVKADRGKVALQRGPLVFCLEGCDNEAAVLSLVIPDDAKLRTKHRRDLLGGVTVVTGKARTAKRTLEGDVVLTREQPFTAIPYYAWAHRGRSPMTVWPARVPEAAYPEPADTLAYTSRATASFVHKSLDAIKDQIVPANSADASAGQLDFWPHKNTTEWLRFEWDRKERISRVKVYWFDDSDHGGCRVPQSWRVLYRDAAGAFQPVSTADSYGTQKDVFNTVTFEAVETDAITIEIVLDEKWSAGVQEVVIE